jgi:cytochrome d ubiquinol oxidase subunit I
MVGIGFLMLGIGAWSLVARWRGKLYDWSLLHRCAVAMGPSGLVAVLAGWVVTEVSLLAFVVVYFAVFGMGIWYLLRLMQKPPEAHEPTPSNAPIRSAGITPAPQILAGAVAVSGKETI